MRTFWLIRMVMVLGLMGRTGFGQQKVQLRLIKTAYYDMQTDVSDERAREAYVRMDRMFEEYTIRTAGFAAPIRSRFVFKLFSREEDYHAAVAPEKTAGVFRYAGNDAELMAIDLPGEEAWHVIQHEGFHHFAWAQINRNLPPWINEGLAEYFGEGRFTGDSYVFGLVSRERMGRLLLEIQMEKLKPFEKMVRLTHEEWNDEMSAFNYDEAWSMVHFLAEGGEGKYRGVFEEYMKLLSRNADSQAAFSRTFGADPQGFQTAWLKYWAKADLEPNKVLLRQADVRTVTSFLARANASGMKQPTVEALFEAVKGKTLKLAPDAVRWLPLALMEPVVKDLARDKVTWEVKWVANRPELTATFDDGVKVTAKFVQRGGVWRTVSEVKGAGAATQAGTRPGR